MSEMIKAYEKKYGVKFEDAPPHVKIMWQDAWQAALQSGEAVAWLFQHENTGRTTCVALGEDEDFAKLNPRWKKASLLYTTPQPVVDRNDLIELLIATRTQSDGVTADLIIKLLKAGKETV